MCVGFSISLFCPVSFSCHVFRFMPSHCFVYRRVSSSLSLIHPSPLPHYNCCCCCCYPSIEASAAKNRGINGMIPLLEAGLGLLPSHHHTPTNLMIILLAAHFLPPLLIYRDEIDRRSCSARSRYPLGSRAVPPVPKPAPTVLLVVCFFWRGLGWRDGVRCINPCAI